VCVLDLNLKGEYICNIEKGVIDLQEYVFMQPIRLNSETEADIDIQRLRTEGFIYLSAQLQVDSEI
jgi:hypothetical protein